MNVKPKIQTDSFWGSRPAYQKLDKICDERSVSEQDILYKKEQDKIFSMDAHVIIVKWDAEGLIKRLNSFGQKVFGYTEDEVINKKWDKMLVAKENKHKIFDNFDRISKGTQIINQESEFISKENYKINIIWNHTLIKHQNEPSEVLSIGIDITERKLLEEKFRMESYYHFITSIQNRDFLDQEVKKLIGDKVPFTLVNINLDNFRHINDTLSYDGGNQFLQYIASKLTQYIKTPHKVAKICGDEFGIIFYRIVSKKVIEDELKLLDQNIGTSWQVNHQEFQISASKGIAMFPKDGMDSNTIFRNANIAMYKAKKQGKGLSVFYAERIMKENKENIELINELQFAIKNNELVLYYQPQYELDSSKITGFEALVRWIHPKKGLISPMKFIPMAEKTGQIYDLEKWIFETALRRKLIFEEEGKKDLYLSINLSSKSLSSELDFHELEHIFSKYDIDYSHIVIEITETAIISDMRFVVERLNKLRRLGMRIALDDFGTGYSSLVHLKDMPIDIVKLDRDFIKSIEEYGNSAIIIKSILCLTADLKYEVVAEGIETIEQLEYLKKYKCKTGQGYLMSEPITIEEAQRLLVRNRDQ